MIFFFFLKSKLLRKGGIRWHTPCFMVLRGRIWKEPRLLRYLQFGQRTHATVASSVWTTMDLTMKLPRFFLWAGSTPGSICIPLCGKQGNMSSRRPHSLFRVSLYVSSSFAYSLLSFGFPSATSHLWDQESHHRLSPPTSICLLLLFSSVCSFQCRLRFAFTNKLNQFLDFIASVARIYI